MIENEQKQEAVKAVTALARFFRISLSKGKSIITVKDELEHVRNYLMIQPFSRNALRINLSIKLRHRRRCFLWRP